MDRELPLVKYESLTWSIGLYEECMKEQWDPVQYAKFEKERQQPFFDLMALIKPYPHMRVVDLGCGDGILTKLLHDRLQADYILGVDSSPAMLLKAQEVYLPAVEFQLADIEDLGLERQFDLVLSNAALQWVYGHVSLLGRLAKMLKPRGQLAIQMPANRDFVTHVIARELAEEPPFNESLSGISNPFQNLLSLEEYAQLLDSLGFKSPLIRLQVYLHRLESTLSVLEWVKGSLLTYYRSHLSPFLYEQFLQEYKKRLLDAIGDKSPFLFPMKRIFIWGELAN
ncbi:trans-aconitate 2-methyltransferase [Candidatus Protochlamydia naegleriophila]|uniref:Trans-aconitate 2-methyltransferase n=2 Tax=Candidatus Protochlamydia naegleriophila TaxID=389348 RepID=A0A0U5JHM2_9BACT|nr:trans-aconitate 2-methyltransferase [Candidatus Protochlamydia naegleriophila]